MRITQIIRDDLKHCTPRLTEFKASAPDVVLAFWSTELADTPDFISFAKECHPNAHLIGCSSSGDIYMGGIVDKSWVLTAIEFEHPTTQAIQVSTKLQLTADSYDAGVRIADQLSKTDLKAILLVSPGIEVNGSALVAGVAAGMPNEVDIFGGLASDNGKFTETSVLSSGGCAPDTVVALGLYGEAIRIATASKGGWRAFGPRRRVTKCDGSLLLEIDGHPALALYKRYLGPFADGLPANGLLFPLEIISGEQDASGLIRTILAVDEQNQSIRLAGSVEYGSYLRLMLASTDLLVDGAEAAAFEAQRLYSGHANLALCVSCVGRKMVMGERTEEEVQILVDQLGGNIVMAGFYANGEIGAHDVDGRPHLHNQTMSMSLIGEALT